MAPPRAHGRARPSRSRCSAAIALVGGVACARLLATAFVGPQPPRDARPRTSLRAGENFFERFQRVASSNINKVLNNLEDPEKVLDQAVDEMQSDLITVRQSYAEVLATQRRLVTQKEEAERISAEWYKRAELAVQKGDDALAKEALTRRQTSVDKAEDLGRQVEGMSANVDKLFDSVKMLEEKIQQAKDEKEQLIARARTAKTTTQVNEMLSDVGTSSAANAFDRMKEKVETMETRAEVSAGMLPAGETPGSLEDKFKQLESGNKVDDELAKLKGAKALPASSDLDKELEAMRKKLKESD